MGTTFKPTLYPHGTLMYLFDGMAVAAMPWAAETNATAWSVPLHSVDV